MLAEDWGNSLCRCPCLLDRLAPHGLNLNTSHTRLPTRLRPSKQVAFSYLISCSCLRQSQLGFSPQYPPPEAVGACCQYHIWMGCRKAPNVLTGMSALRCSAGFPAGQWVRLAGFPSRIGGTTTGLLPRASQGGRASSRAGLFKNHGQNRARQEPRPPRTSQPPFGQHVLEMSPPCEHAAISSLLSGPGHGMHPTFLMVHVLIAAGGGG